LKYVNYRKFATEGSPFLSIWKAILVPFSNCEIKATRQSRKTISTAVIIRTTKRNDNKTAKCTTFSLQGAGERLKLQLMGFTTATMECVWLH